MKVEPKSTARILHLINTLSDTDNPREHREAATELLEYIGRLEEMQEQVSTFAQNFLDNPDDPCDNRGVGGVCCDSERK